MTIQDIAFQIGGFIENLFPHPDRYCFSCKRRIREYETYIVNQKGKARKFSCWECYEKAGGDI
jgi:hypothetical protein